MKSKLLKKAVSYLLTFMLVFGTAVVGANAATIDGAQSLENENCIYFDLNGTGWTDTKTVFCHIWAVDNSGIWPSWQSKAEQCTYNAQTGIATYNLSKTGYDIQPDDGKIYSVIFSTDTGAQTYNNIMSGACIGDTAYCTGNIIENPMDSSKTAFESAWRNNLDCGPQKQITSTGNVIGRVHAENSNDDTMLANFLIAYYQNDELMSQLTFLMTQLSVFKSTTMEAVVTIEESDVAHEKKTQEQANAEIEAIEKVLDTYAPAGYNDEITYPDITQIGLKLKDSPWKNSTEFYCHIYNARTGKGITQWQSEREKMTIENGMALYDIKNAGLGIDYVSDTEYAVVFGDNNGYSTYPMTLSGACMGDYVTIHENPWASASENEKAACIGRWNINNKCGTHFSIKPNGRGFGAYLYDFENAYDIIEDYLIDSCLESVGVNFDTTKIQDIIVTLETHISKIKEDVYEKLNAKQLAGEITFEQMIAVNAKITETLNPCNDHSELRDIYLDTSACTYETTWDSDQIYCHIWRVDNSGRALDYQTEKELCEYNYFTGIATYCLKNTNYDFAPSDTKAYYVTFSDANERLSYTLVMDGSCVGDTVALSGLYDDKSARGVVMYNAHWENSRTCGQVKQIINNMVFGKVLPCGQTDEMILAKYLIANSNDSTVVNIYNLQNLYNNLDISIKALKIQLDKGLEDHTDRDTALTAITAVLNNIDTSDQHMFGDLSDDYLLTVEDATIEQRILAGIEGYVYLGQEAMADVNRDGYVTIEDATLIQRIAGEVE